MSIQTTIASAAEKLPPSLARIARTIADDPTIVVDSTITEIAARCDTSVASVVRFCRTIGVNGYAALRMALATELGRESVQFPAASGFVLDGSTTMGLDASSFFPGSTPGAEFRPAM